jgi:hypothetical protein
MYNLLHAGGSLCSTQLFFVLLSHGLVNLEKNLKLVMWSEINLGLLMNKREVDTSLGMLHIQEDDEGLE